MLDHNEGCVGRQIEAQVVHAHSQEVLPQLSKWQKVAAAQLQTASLSHREACVAADGTQQGSSMHICVRLVSEPSLRPCLGLAHLEDCAVGVVGCHGYVLEHVQALRNDGQIADEEAGVKGACAAKHGLHHSTVSPLLSPNVWEAAATVNTCTVLVPVRVYEAKAPMAHTPSFACCCICRAALWASKDTTTVVVTGSQSIST